MTMVEQRLFVQIVRWRQSEVVMGEEKGLSGVAGSSREWLLFGGRLSLSSTNKRTSKVLAGSHNTI
jgi:hypothetical protein